MALINCNFSSSVLGFDTSMTVILPDQKHAQENQSSAKKPLKHPALYLLHGLSDDHTAWQRRTSIERYVSSLNLAVVMPNVHRSFYTDMAHGYRYWEFISEELPETARSFFPLSDKRRENFTAGLSMGGYGAFKLALTYPERYSAAASLSGALDVKRFAFESDKQRIAECKNIFGNVDKLANSKNDLFYLAKQLSKSENKQPLLYQWCGTEDFLYEDNLNFRNHARKLSLNLTYKETPGDHNWMCWDKQIQDVLSWLPLAENARSQKHKA